MTSKQPSDQPSTQSDESNHVEPTKEPSFGWNQYAEQLNGRFAMMGFVALLLLEFFTKQDFFTWMGIR